MKKVIARFSFEENGRRVARERGMDVEFNPTLHTWDVYKNEPDPQPEPVIRARNTHTTTVEYMVYGESPNSYVEDGVEKRAYSLTGHWPTSDKAQEVITAMAARDPNRLEDPWDYRVVKCVTEHTVKFFEVYDGV